MMVLQEFLKANGFIWSESMLDIVVSCEHIKEFKTAIFNCTSPSDYIWVTRRIKPTFYFIKIKNSILILIENGKGLLYNILSVLRKITQHSEHEFLKVDSSVAIVVEDRENLVSLWPCASNSVIIESFSEFTKVKLTTTIRVHNLKLTAQSNHSFSPSLYQLLPETTNYQFILFLMRKGTKVLNWSFKRPLI